MPQSWYLKDEILDGIRSRLEKPSEKIEAVAIIDSYDQIEAKSSQEGGKSGKISKIEDFSCFLFCGLSVDKKESAHGQQIQESKKDKEAGIEVPSALLVTAKKLRSLNIRIVDPDNLTCW